MHPLNFSDIKYDSGSLKLFVPATLKIYDALGNQITELFDEQTEAGKIYNLEFDAGILSSGIYFYKLETPSHTIHRKMLLIK